MLIFAIKQLFSKTPSALRRNKTATTGVFRNIKLKTKSTPLNLEQLFEDRILSIKILFSTTVAFNLQLTTPPHVTSPFSLIFTDAVMSKLM